MMKHDLSVIGAGSYGTSLAIVAASKGLRVMLWDRKQQRAQAMQRNRVNSQYLDGITFPDSLTVTSSLEEAVSSSLRLLVVVPSVTFKDVITDIAEYITKQHILAWATKGLSLDGRFLSDVAREILPFKIPLAILSGPTFARELAKGLPTAISVASDPPDVASKICAFMHTDTFRLYESTDMIGLQVGGAVKNVIAIAAGMSDGLGYGANARTAVITRGLAEMVRFGVACGARERSFMGLSGFGDLILTCTDDQSRNRRFGVLTGRGMPVNNALKEIGQVVEGYSMISVVKDLAFRMHLEMPICSELYEVLYCGKNCGDAARALLTRELKSE